MIPLFLHRLITQTRSPLPSDQRRRDKYTPETEIEALAFLDSDLIDFEELVTLPGSYWHADEESNDGPDAPLIP